MTGAHTGHPREHLAARVTGGCDVGDDGPPGTGVLLYQRRGVEALVPENPTAQQSVALAQLTPLSALCVLPGGTGLGTMLHPFPVSCSISVGPP